MRIFVAIIAALSIAILAGAWSYESLPMRECAWCGGHWRLNRHHIVPQHIAPERRDDPANLVVLCRPCHLCIGHVGNWRRENTNLVAILALKPTEE